MTDAGGGHSYIPAGYGPGSGGAPRAGGQGPAGTIRAEPPTDVRDQPPPAPETASGPVTPGRIAAKFARAVAWGEHLVVWDLFSTDARNTVLRVATNRGMDERLAGRLRDGTATPAERDAFLVDLVNGLRTDLRDCDLNRGEFDTDLDAADADANHAWVIVPAPLMHPALGALPVASMELVREIGHWRVQHVTPRTKR